MELTPRQKEIFRFVRAFIRERGYPPSVREIGQQFNIYPRAAFDHLKALERKGYLKRRRSASRGLEVLTFQELASHGSPGKLSRKGEKLPVREIPLVGKVAAGIPALATENIEGTLLLPSEWVKGEEVFLLKVKGDSMSPYILPDDQVVVRSQSSAENGDVVVTLVDEEATVKRFYRQGKRIELRPDNGRWETIHIKEGSKEVRILGKVVGIFRKV